MVLPAQQLTQRSSRVYNTITIPKAKYPRAQAYTTKSYPDSETVSDTDTSVYERDGEGFIYLAFGTTCHQDLYPRRSSRLVISRPKKVVRKVVPFRKKIQWPDATNHKELALFYHKQIEGRVMCGATPSGSITSTAAREVEALVRGPNNIDLTCTGQFPSSVAHEKHHLSPSGNMSARIGTTMSTTTSMTISMSVPQLPYGRKRPSIY